MQNTVVRTSLTEQVYMLIINKIQRNELRPGDRLNIEELAKEFNASRTPVREAINRLVQDGFIEQVHNSGPKVISLTNKQCVDLIFTNATLFTGVLESLRSNENKNEIIKELKEVIGKQEKYLTKQSSEKYFLYAIEFHIILINYCENLKLKQLTQQTQTQIDMFVLYYLMKHENREKSLADHKALLDYLIEDDFDSLINCMKEHNLSALHYFEEA